MSTHYSKERARNLAAAAAPTQRGVFYCHTYPHLYRLFAGTSYERELFYVLDEKLSAMKFEFVPYDLPWNLTFKMYLDMNIDDKFRLDSSKAIFPEDPENPGELLDRAIEFEFKKGVKPSRLVKKADRSSLYVGMDAAGTLLGTPSRIFPGFISTHRKLCERDVENERASTTIESMMRCFNLRQCEYTSEMTHLSAEELLTLKVAVDEGDETYIQTTRAEEICDVAGVNNSLVDKATSNSEFTSELDEYIRDNFQEENESGEGERRGFKNIPMAAVVFDIPLLLFLPFSPLTLKKTYNKLHDYTVTMKMFLVPECKNVKIILIHHTKETMYLPRYKLDVSTDAGLYKSEIRLNRLLNEAIHMHWPSKRVLDEEGEFYETLPLIYFDDGINSTGLRELEEWCSRVHTPTLRAFQAKKVGIMGQMKDKHGNPMLPLEVLRRLEPATSSSGKGNTEMQQL